MQLTQLAPWLPNYVKAWGPVEGLATFARVGRMVQANSEDAAPVRLPDLGRTVWLRAARHDINIFQQVWVKHEYDIREAPQFTRLQQAYDSQVTRGQRPLIVDCGAHIGMSVLWWRHLFPQAQIVAVEPSNANMAVLRRNLDGLNAVTILHGGVWNQESELAIQDEAAGMSAFQLRQSTGGSVRAYTLNGIMQDAGCDECLVLKVDIEGGEDALFRDNLQWLDRTRCVAIELHDWMRPWSGQTRNLFRATSARDFDYVMRGENMLCFQDLG